MPLTGISGKVKLCFGEKHTTREIPLSGCALKKVSFNCKIDEDDLEKLKIKAKNDFNTYFVVVSQNPIENSVINLVSPIFVNEKEKLIAQYVTSQKVDPCLASINECATL